MLNFSAEIFFWRILQLWFNENVSNYYIDQKECVEWQSIQKNWYIWNIEFSFFFFIQLAF